ncbi:hypothetical protein AX16_006889 [Volvariella volvacea WC 439]|nr:hypothetical protein AX16_006889 [Volvariella volvacea WC 439]
MATVHPSRMGLVPQDPPTYYQGNTTGPSSSSQRPPSPRFNRDSDYRQSRRRYEDRDSRRRSWDKNGSRGRSRSRSVEKARDHSRSRSRDRRRGRDYGDGRPERRRSPEYNDYRRPSPLRGRDDSPPPRRDQGNAYYGRRDYGRDYNLGPEFLESRRTQRENVQVNIWPQSPKAPTRSESPERGKSRKKSKRSRSSSISDTDSEDERRRRKERKRARKERERERKNKKKRRSRSRRRSAEVDSEEEYARRRKRSHSRSGTPTKERAPSPSRSPSPSAEASEDEWVEKTISNAPVPLAAHMTSAMEKSKGQAQLSQPEDDDSDFEIGPTPFYKPTGKQKVDERAYGGALLRGEGSAMAAYLRENTEARIPRRGEIGLTSDQIAEFENVGYVMSGSRHRRMNAVRIRKENQVISAEEKRGILKLQKEEKARREAILQEEFKELVNDKLKAAAVAPPDAP